MSKTDIFKLILAVYNNDEKFIIKKGFYLFFVEYIYCAKYIFRAMCL